jgi:hypothetical protein
MQPNHSDTGGVMSLVYARRRIHLTWNYQQFEGWKEYTWVVTGGIYCIGGDPETEDRWTLAYATDPDGRTITFNTGMPSGANYYAWAQIYTELPLRDENGVKYHILSTPKSAYVSENQDVALYINNLRFQVQV